VRPDVGAQPPGGHEVHFSSEEVFEEEDQAHEISEGGLFELHQDVDVACLVLFASGIGAENSYPPDAKLLFNFVLVRFQDIEHVHVRPPGGAARQQAELDL